MVGVSTYLEDRHDVEFPFEVGECAIIAHHVRLREFSIEAAAVFEHLKPQVPEIGNVNTVQVLGRHAGVHEMAHVAAQETSYLQ